MRRHLKIDIFDLIPIKTIYTVASIFFVAGFALMAWFGIRYYELREIKKSVAINQTQSDIGTKEAEKCDYRRWFDGVCVATEAERSPALVAVMIENHTEARPMSGLASAAIVYEAPVEAMFTRFMAIYPLDEQVKKAGPVRSARPYYIDWLSEYGNIMFMHVGGSPEALDLIDKKNVFSINEMYLGNNFWRSIDRYAPHNTYTSNDLWKKAWDYNAGTNSSKELIQWAFAVKEPCLENCAREISIDFLPPNYTINWKYDSDKGVYIRSEAGSLHKDQDGEQITADTIIVQRISYSVLDEVGRLRLDTVGAGEALVFRDGYAVKGVWKKNDFGERTMWLDEDGKFMELKPGKIWIEVAPIGRVVSYK